MEKYRPSVIQPETELDNSFSYSEYWPVAESIDHEGRPITQPETKEERHEDNLSRLHGVYWHGVYYHHGVPQNEE